MELFFSWGYAYILYKSPVQLFTSEFGQVEWKIGSVKSVESESGI